MSPISRRRSPAPRQQVSHQSPPRHAQHQSLHHHQIQGQLASDWLARLRRWRQFDADSQSTLAECFDAACVSRMTVPDPEPSLPCKRSLKVTDPWRHEWQRGVQVPIDPVRQQPPPTRCLPPYSMTAISGADASSSDVVHNASIVDRRPAAAAAGRHHQSPAAWRLPPSRFLRTLPRPAGKKTGGTAAAASASTPADDPVGSSSYCLDELDARWSRLASVRPDHLEAVVTAAEVAARARLRDRIRADAGLGIEFDASVACSACQSPEATEDNAIVFCDGCDAPVHQACYGIRQLPSGRWLCRPCAQGLGSPPPPCALCPVVAGAAGGGGVMKATRDGSAWCHVACALWLPEITFGDPGRMEPIVGLGEVPQWRRGLLCRVCRQRGDGACVRCGVRRCQAAFHVGCLAADTRASPAAAVTKRGIMAAVEATSGRASGDCVLGRKYLVYCSRHADTKEAARAMGRERQWRRQRAMMKRQRWRETGGFSAAAAGNKASGGAASMAALSDKRTMRLKELEANFHSLVSQADISRSLGSLKIDAKTVSLILDYWKLKRTANGCRPLLNTFAGASTSAGVESEATHHHQQYQHQHVQHHRAHDDEQHAAESGGGDHAAASITSSSPDAASSSTSSSASLSLTAAASAVSLKERQRFNDRARSLVRLRLDLERVRNLCYLVVRREKTKRAVSANLGQLSAARIANLRLPTATSTTASATREPQSPIVRGTNKDGNNNSSHSHNKNKANAAATTVSSSHNGTSKSAVATKLKRSVVNVNSTAAVAILRHRLRRENRRRRSQPA